MKQPTRTILIAALASLSSCSKDKIEEEPAFAELVEMAGDDMAEMDKVEVEEPDPACPGATKMTALKFEYTGLEPLAPLPAQFSFAKAKLSSNGLAIHISTQDWSIKELDRIDIKSKDKAIFSIYVGGKEFVQGSDFLATSYDQMRGGVHTNGWALGFRLTKTSHLKILAISKKFLCGEFAFEIPSDKGKGVFVGKFVAPLTGNWR